MVRKKGVIVNIASIMAVIPSPLLTVYAATKAYIFKFSKRLYLKYYKYGIIVQCLLPPIEFSILKKTILQVVVFFQLQSSMLNMQSEICEKMK